MKFLMTTTLLAGSLYLVICGLLYFMQRAMLYFPTPPSDSDNAETIWLHNDNQKLKIWHVPATGNRALIYFGGNAEDVALNITQFKHLFPGYSLYLQNYRGYGGSSGSPTEAALFTDSLALYDFVANSATEIVVLGRSLGTGVAVYLASERPVKRLALVTPFDSMTNVASNHYPFFPVKLLLQDRYESLSRTPSLNMETLILIAEHDEVIPRKHTDALVAALPGLTTQVVTVPTTSHNNIGEAPAYEQALYHFFSQP